MYSFEFERLIRDAALSKARAWDCLAGYLCRAMEEVVRGMLNPPPVDEDRNKIAVEVAIAAEVLHVAQKELQRLSEKIRDEPDIDSALSRALGFPKKPLTLAFEQWILRLVVRHCHVHYRPWLDDTALRELHRFQGALPPADLMEKAMRECLARLEVTQRAVLVLYNVGSVLTVHNVTFRDIAAILGWGESDQAAEKAQRLSERGKSRIKQILAHYGYT